MLYNAKNGTVPISGTDMDYIAFGNGSETVIMLPGLGDGLRTVKGMAVTMAFMFKQYAKRYKVYVFSRKNQLEPNYSTREMARDQKEAMEKLGISKAHILGISQGGMIAQFLAIDYPNLVEKLVLAVTLAGQNETAQKTIGLWVELAKANDYKNLFIDTSENSYTEKYVKRYRPFYPLLSRFTKPKDYERFIIQASACLHHNAYSELEKINCPTLVIGADCDKIVTGNASIEINDRIPGSQLVMYKGYGHGVYEESKEFHQRILDFLNISVR